MSANINHPSFPQPSDKTDKKAKLWRFFDFSKYVSLISSGKLYFCSLDRFEDPFEGLFSKANRNPQNRGLFYPKIPKETDENILKGLSVASSYSRKSIYANCWHLNEYESAAMWNLYSKTNETVAIETTYSTLTRILPENVYLGCVTYIDYEKDWMPESNLLYPCMYKRKSF